MSLEAAWRDRSDGELAVAASTLSDYTEDAQRVITAELERRGITPDAAPPTATLGVPHEHRDLPVAWLRFWTWVRLPGGALLGLVTIGQAVTAPRSVMEPQHPLASFASIVLGVAVASAALIVAVGLQKRLLWAWRANFALICAEVLLVPAGIVLNAPKSPMATVVGYCLGVGLFALAWLWPNAVYFHKRRHLFSAPPNARPTTR